MSQASLVLIKLGSVTHSWDSGQRLIDLPIETLSNRLRFTTDSSTRTEPEPCTRRKIPASYSLLRRNRGQWHCRVFT